MRARTILSLCCFLVLLLAGSTLFAEPASSGAPNLKPADQQFLKSLGVPEPTAMACAPGFCSNAAKQACWDYCWQTYMCTGGLSCNYTTCTTTCWCSPVACY
jgi:hypothetical protein